MSIRGCPHCGKDFDWSSQICPRCGTKILVEGKVVPYSKAQLLAVIIGLLFYVSGAVILAFAIGISFDELIAEVPTLSLLVSIELAGGSTLYLIGWSFLKIASE